MNRNNRESFRKSVYLAAYTGLFLVMALVIYGVFLKNGRLLVYKDDASKQHFKAFAYYGQYLRAFFTGLFRDHTLRLPRYSFGLGYGADILTTLNYYAFGDPLNLISVFVPLQYAGIAFSVLVVLRTYLAGLSFSVYCFCREETNPRAILAGALTYAFCDFMLYGALKHCFFANPMIYLPLILTGCERIWKKQKPGLFIFMVAISVISNFYYFYTIVIMTVLYVLFREADLLKERRFKAAGTDVLRFGIYGILGTMLGGCTLLPVMLVFLGNPRSGTSVTWELFYHRKYYERMVTWFLTNYLGEYWSRLGYPAIVVLGFFFLLLTRRKYGKLKSGILLLSVFLLLPAFGYAFNGFSYVSNRWIFAYSLLLAYMVTRLWDDFFRVSWKKAAVMAGMFILYYLLCMRYATFFGAKRELFFALAAALAACAVMILAGVKRLEPWHRLLETGLLLTVVCNLLVLGHYGYTAGGELKIEDFRAANDFYAKLTTSEGDAVKAVGDPDTPYRYSGEVYDGTNGNSTLLNGTSSVQFFWSLSDGSVPEAYTEWGVMENVSADNYKKLDNRAILNTLAGVKYFVTWDDDEIPAIIPYGFDVEIPLEGKLGDKYRVYRNRNALPLAYTYDTWLPAEEYEQLDSVQKESALLQAVVLEQDPEGLQKAQPAFPEQELPYEVSCLSDQVSLQENSFVVTKDGASARLTFAGLPDSETMLYFKGFRFNGTRTKDLYNEEQSIDPLDLYGKEEWEALSEKDRKKMNRSAEIWVEPTGVAITLKGGRGEEICAEKEFRYLSPKNSFYWGRHDFVNCFGYDAQGLTYIDITFPYRGIYSFDSMKLFGRPMEGFAEAADRLREDTVQDLDLHNTEETAYATDHVTGTITLEQPKFLLLAIPYAKGWKAYVDGEEQELLKANSMYMGLMLQGGNHEILLTYHTPGQTAGWLVSLAGLLGTALVLAVNRKRGYRYREV